MYNHVKNMMFYIIWGIAGSSAMKKVDFISGQKEPKMLFIAALHFWQFIYLITFH